MPQPRSVSRQYGELLGRLPPQYRELVENLRMRRAALLNLLEQDVAAAVHTANEQVALTTEALHAFRHDRLRLAAVRAYRNELFLIIGEGKRHLLGIATTEHGAVSGKRLE